MTMSIRVLLADDHQVFRDGLRELLESEGDIWVVAQAANSEEALVKAIASQPDVAVLDIRMPGAGGIETAALIRQQAPAVRTLMLTMSLSAEHVHRAGLAGAQGYVLKDAPAEEFIHAVRTVASGQTYYMAGLPVALKNAAGESIGPLESLDERERMLLDLLVNGKSNAEAAQVLQVSVRTVEVARGSLHRKLSVTDLPALVKFAVLHGLTTLD
jgi:DNA-binding NarL/FixJ family response regulator